MKKQHDQMSTFKKSPSSYNVQKGSEVGLLAGSKQLDYYNNPDEAMLVL